MATFRIQKNSENPYVMLDKFSINDSALSWKAKGLLACIESLGGITSISELNNMSTDGDAATRSGIQELLDRGIIVQEVGYGSSVELKVERILIENSIEHEREKTFERCELKRKLRFDFFLPEINTVIELDGPHHFFDVYGNIEDVQRRDSIKNEFCKGNGIKIVRVPFEKFDDIEAVILRVINERG
ncbi:MAG: DUF2726 domain-containing protein [Desulfovibrio sp.]